PLEALEPEGLRQGAVFAGPAGARGEEGSERGLVQARLVLGDRHGFEPSLYAFRTRRPDCVILTAPKLCEPTWLVERPVPPVTYAKTGASAPTDASVPAHAARKGSPSCPTSSSWALWPSSRLSSASGSPSFCDARSRSRARPPRGRTLIACSPRREPGRTRSSSRPRTRPSKSPRQPSWKTVSVEPSCSAT